MTVSSAATEVLRAALASLRSDPVSVERLLRFLAALDQMVEIVVTPLPKCSKPVKVSVRAA